MMRYAITALVEAVKQADLRLWFDQPEPSHVLVASAPDGLSDFKLERTTDVRAALMEAGVFPRPHSVKRLDAIVRPMGVPVDEPTTTTGAAA